MTHIILGGGIGGLSAAYYLRKLGSNYKIVLIEASSRLGGWINTYQTPHGSVYELGPRSLRYETDPAAMNTLHLADELKLFKEMIYVSRIQAVHQNRLIKVNGSLHRLPSFSLMNILKKNPPFTQRLSTLLLKEIFVPKSNQKDESFYSFYNKRLGSEFANYVADPVARGMFAGSSEEISVKAIHKNHDKEHGSIVKASVMRFFKKRTDIPKSFSNYFAQQKKWAFWSLSGGLSMLVNSLENFLMENDVTILKNTVATDLSFGIKNVNVATNAGDFEGDKVISCLPAYRLKELVRNTDRKLENVLGTIPFVTVAVVNLEYKKINMGPAFGYMIPSCEEGKALGVIFDTCSFNQGDKTIFTVMLGGHWFDKYFGSGVTEEEILNIAISEVSTTLCIKTPPIHTKVSILKDCIPQYTVGHFDRVESAKEIIKNLNIPLSLGGNSFTGVGVNDCIYTSKQLVDNLNN